jgi:hypothetical protein
VRKSNDRDPKNAPRSISCTTVRLRKKEDLSDAIKINKLESITQISKLFSHYSYDMRMRVSFRYKQALGFFTCQWYTMLLCALLDLCTLLKVECLTFLFSFSDNTYFSFRSDPLSCRNVSYHASTLSSAARKSCSVCRRISRTW